MSCLGYLCYVFGREKKTSNLIEPWCGVILTSLASNCRHRSMYPIRGCKCNDGLKYGVAQLSPVAKHCRTNLIVWSTCLTGACVLHKYNWTPSYILFTIQITCIITMDNITCISLFQERIRAWFHNRTKINWGPYGRLT